MTWVRARNPQEALRQLEDERQAPATLAAAVPLSVAQKALEGHPWRFASTMKDTPHHYTHAKHWNDGEWAQVVATIRANGEIRWFRGWPYLELDLGEHTYWTMGYPVSDTTIINRRDR